MFKLVRLSPIVLTIAALAAPAAYAGPLVFNFTLTGTDTGNIAITEDTGVITNITGTFDGAAISALLPTGLGTIGNPDNVFLTLAPYLDGFGVSFSLASLDSRGFGFVNLSWNSTFLAYYSEQSATSTNTGGQSFGPIAFLEVPEPATGVISLSAIAAILVVRNRLKR